jgi:hypothetical protein
MFRGEVASLRNAEKDKVVGEADSFPYRNVGRFLGMDGIALVVRKLGYCQFGPEYCEMPGCLVNTRILEAGPQTVTALGSTIKVGRRC